MELLNKITALEHDATAFGFAWEKTDQIMAQIYSECEEIQEHLAKAHPDRIELQEEIGDLLHAVFSLCVFCQFSPQNTLEKTLNKFELRLNYVKKLATDQGLKNLNGHAFDTLMQYWDQAKVLATQDLQNITNISDFELDHRIASSCIKIIDWPLSSVLLKNNAIFPWFILVPRQNNMTEITQLSQADRYQLMDEIHALSTFVESYYQPDKINTGALGNIVSQLHIHVIARFKSDPAWPQGVWQAGQPETPYADVENLVKKLRAAIKVHKPLFLL